MNTNRVHDDAGFLRDLQGTIADIANTIAEFEPVILMAAAGDHTRARRMLSGQVELWDIPTEDLWCRDAGPLFVTDGRGGLAISQLQFNGWGRKQEHARDARVAAFVAAQAKAPRIRAEVVMEGGCIEVDGEGTEQGRPRLRGPLHLP